MPLVAAVSLLLVACVSESRPATCDEPSVTIELELSTDGLSPTNPAVCRDQGVTLEIASEVDGIIHIHGYDAQVAATEVISGETLRLEFIAERAGQFPIELHPADDPRGVDVGIFSVHEP
ncbi:MAG: hypothetical protein M3Y29_02300 [Chloroflexota bacterium]|jgi:6,7-dimethyl-8-ribityllumazine synthase|nr:hypothetical protein [Chloroflexota bacterium]